MLENNQKQNEFDDSLYQDDKKKKFKMIVIILAVILVVVGLLFVFFRKKTETTNTQTKNNIQLDNIAEVNQVATAVVNEEAKRIEEQLAKFSDDKDRDGLSVEREKELGTSDNDSDTDWDSLPDKDEVEKWGTDPLKVDTDGDGYGDGFEINAGFNPKGPGKLPL